jgi:hypothetical protein
MYKDNKSNTTVATSDTGTVHPYTRVPPSFSGFPVIHFVHLHVFTFFIPCCDVRYDFRVKAFVLTPVCFVGGKCFIYAICIYLRILVSNTISMSEYIRVV